MHVINKYVTNFLTYHLCVYFFIVLYRNLSFVLPVKIHNYLKQAREHGFSMDY